MIPKITVWFACAVGLGALTAGAQSVPSWLDYEAFFTEDADRLDAAASSMFAAPHRVWSDPDVDVLELYRRVLREGRELARVAWTSSLFFYLSGVSSFPPDVVDELPQALFEETRAGFLVPDEVGTAEAYRMAVVAAGRAEALFAAVPALIAEEYKRQLEPNGQRNDWEVLDLLFGMAFLDLRIGARESREDVGAEWLARSPGYLEEHFPALVGVREPGRFFLLGDTLREVPEEVRPALERVIDLRVRQSADGAIRAGYTGDYATYLLSDERPLGSRSAAVVFEAHCSATHWERCGEFVARLFAGPDDSGLGVIRADVEAWVLQGLSEGVAARAEGCEEREALVRGLERPVSRRSGTGLELLRLAEKIRSGGARIMAALEIAERLDEPSAEIMRAVYEYWYGDRDPRAEVFLRRQDHWRFSAQGDVRHGMGLGHCLARNPDSTFLVN